MTKDIVNLIAEQFAASMRGVIHETDNRGCRAALLPVVKAFWSAHSKYSPRHGTDMAYREARDARGRFNRRWGRLVEDGDMTKALQASARLTPNQLDQLIGLIKPTTTEDKAAPAKAS